MSAKAFRFAAGLIVLTLARAQQAPLEKTTINYPARTGTTWPPYIAKEGGYHQKYGLEVNLVFGVHPAGIAMIVSGEAAMTNYTMEQAMQAASMLTAPVYFKLEAEGYRSLANISDYDDIYAPTVYLFRKATVAGNPGLPELIVKAQAEAIKRFYEDKAFVLKVYLKYSPAEDPADVERVYDRYA